MKKCFVIVLAFVMLFSFASAELSENEQEFLGSWVMCMKKEDTTYLYTITFFDDMQVVLKTLSFSGSTLVSDHKASGQWCSMTAGTVILALAGNEFAGVIYDDGLFGLLDYKTKEPSGFFSRCPDLSYKME